jgi:diguanylate cyclase (GGDEF)-like protein
MLEITNFRGRLALWFAGLSLLTLVSVGLYVGRLATRQMAVTAGESLHTTAMAAADLLGANLRDRELEIVLLSQLPYFARGDLANPDILLSLEQRKKFQGEFAWLGVADIDGKVVQGVNGMLQGQSVSKRPWFIAGLQGRYTGDVHEALLLAKLLPGQASGEPLRFIDFAAPILNREGKVVGVLGAHGHWSWVTNTVMAATQRLARDSSTEILIVDKHGTVLYPQGSFDRTHMPGTMPSDQAYATVAWGDGRDYLTSRVAVDAHTQTNQGWQIVVRQPLETALQPIYALRLRLAALGFAAIVVCALVALRLAQNVSQPIEQLAAAARQIERREGVPQFPTKTRVREVAQLSQSMQTMTESLLQREHELETLNHTLEQQVLQRTEALAAANSQLEQLATRDALTGLYNRRRLDEKLADCVQSGKRVRRGFSMLLLDADHFKRVNDTYGHSIGDAVLKQLARLLTEHTRATDFVARYGGEEFVVLLPETAHHDEALTVAEKVRSAVEHAQFPQIGRLTISIGISLWSPKDSSSAELFKRADEALYLAKSCGRNQVVVAGSSA